MKKLNLIPMLFSLLFIIAISSCSDNCYRCIAIDPNDSTNQFFQDHCDETTQQAFEDQFAIDHAGYTIECRKK